MEKGKEAAGAFAANLVQEGMLVGLGTGSTAHYFIEHLARRCKEGLDIQAVTTSVQSEKLAKKSGIPLLDVNSITWIDLTVDGADEVDSKKRLIKGAGGALLREKIIASSSKEMVVIVDQSKLVDRLGKCKLPVEILPFAYHATIAKIELLGLEGEMRAEKEGGLYMTDNGNYLYDIDLKESVDDVEKLHLSLLLIPGVLETGFFISLAGRVIIGSPNGHVEVRE